MRITQIEPTPSEASPNRIFGQNPQVTDELLDDVVRRILSVGTPLKIVLFGSQARGEAGLNSDLDLLIIEPSNLPRYKRAPRYLRALVGIFPAKDVVVWTPEEIKEWSAVPDAFITTALGECSRLSTAGRAGS